MVLRNSDWLFGLSAGLTQGLLRRELNTHIEIFRANKLVIAGVMGSDLGCAVGLEVFKVDRELWGGQ